MTNEQYTNIFGTNALKTKITNVSIINGKDYKVKKLSNGKHIIVHKKTGKKLVTLENKEIGEYDWIDKKAGFLQGETGYCVVRQNNKYAILDVINNEIITDWYNWIYAQGFVKGKSNYCIVKEENEAVLNVLSNKIITNWYIHIFDGGFTKYQLNFCKCELLNKKYIDIGIINKKYRDSLIDKFVMTVRFTESLWEYWYKCF